MSLFTDASLVVKPSLYKTGKLYSIKPGTGLGDLSVVRNSVKWGFGPNGVLRQVAANVPLIEYDPVTRVERGLLVEPGATNIALRSQDPANAYWIKTNATATNDISVAPDGTLTMGVLTENASNSTHGFYKDFGTTIGLTYSWSVFAKEDTRRYAVVLVDLTGSGAKRGHIIDLRDGTVTHTFAGTAANSVWVEPQGNGIYRITITVTATNTSSFATVGLSNGPTTDTYTGDGASRIGVWGMNFFQGVGASSYMPTVASTFNRVADVVSLTGASSLIGATEGTLYAEVQISAFGNSGIFFSVNDATTNNRIQLYKFTDAKIRADRISATQSSLTSIATDVVSAGIFKVAFAYKTGDSAMFINGVQVGSTATQTFTFGAMGRIDIGARFDSTQIFNDHVRSAVLFPIRKNNAELAAMTT
jgi:hypothetical protein